MGTSREEKEVEGPRAGGARRRGEGITQGHTPRVLMEVRNCGWKEEMEPLTRAGSPSREPARHPVIGGAQYRIKPQGSLFKKQQECP